MSKFFDKLTGHIGSGNKPPPVPLHSKPSQPLTEPYFKPMFHPSLPVSQYFKHEIGAHGWGNNELQNYIDATSNSFHDENGALVIRAIANSASLGDKYTSARLRSYQQLARNRGCLTVRLTPPCAEGVWPAFWLLPADPFTWPTDGEIDIFESWNGDRVNHSCLHWGFYNGEDYWKHRVRETPIPDMDRKPGGQVFAFAWDQPATGPGGRMAWFINGQPVMRADIPDGTRRMADFNIVINVACGGNVCQGKVPRDGTYEFKIHELTLSDQPDGGWAVFERAWNNAPLGNTM